MVMAPSHLTCKQQNFEQHMEVLLLLGGRTFQHVMYIKNDLLTSFLEKADPFGWSFAEYFY